MSCFVILYLLISISKSFEQINDIDQKYHIKNAIDDLFQLSKYSETNPPAITRVLFSDADMKARKFIKTLMSNLNLKVIK